MTDLVSVAGWRDRLSETRLSAYTFPAGYFMALSLLVFAPLVEPGYVLTLDMIFGPHTDYLQFGLHAKGPLYYGRFPFLAVLDALTFALDDWVVQKIVLVSLPVLCGLAMYAACGARTHVGALFAGTLYAVNPFVYVRLLAGHWYFLLGYAFVPLALVAFDRYLDQRGSLRRAVGWTTLVSVFDPHATVLVALGGWCLWAVRVWGTQRPSPRSSTRSLTRRFGTFCLSAGAVNAYWLLPAVVAAVGGGTHLTTISGADLTVFSARGTVADNVPLSVAMLYGFWRGGATTTMDLVPLWVVGLLFAALLFLAVSGGLRNWGSPTARGFALAGVVAFVLSLGVSTAVSEPLFRTLTDVVPVLRGMRDSQKFSGLVVLTYAFLGARGVDHLVSPGRSLSPPVPSRHTVARLALVALVLLTPLAYAAPMFGGFDGQVETTTYPDSWHAANDHLASADGDGRALFLPWHGYLSFSWTERRIATPAPMVFERRVVVGQNIEVGGIDTRASDPTHTQVRQALTNPADPTFGDDLASVGIEYVILAHEADFQQYAALDEHEDFTVAFAGDGITVYENEAYEDDDTTPWPRAGPPVPTVGLLVGCLVSLVAGGLLVRKSLAQ